MIGIDSVMALMEKRIRVWELLAGAYKPPLLNELCVEIGLEQVIDKTAVLLKGQSKGRTIVKL